MNQIQTNPIYRNKQTEETSKYLIDVLPKQLTFNPALLFDEIEILPIEQVNNELIVLPSGTSKYSLAKTNDWIVGKIKNHILSCWNKDKIKIVLYYPNIESKILAVILRQLYNENSDLGQILFVHIPPENNVFQETMEHIGWYTEYAFITNSELLSKAFRNFDKADWINYPGTLADNLNALILAILRDRELEDIQLISPFSYLDKANHRHGNKLNSIVSTQNLNIYPDDTILPFLAYPVLEAAVKSRHRGILPFALLEHLDSKLFQFSNYGNEFLTMPKFLQNYVLSYYEQSTYYKIFNRKLIIPDRLSFYGEWSNKLLLAMFWQTLTKKGYTINVF